MLKDVPVDFNADPPRQEKPSGVSKERLNAYGAVYRSVWRDDAPPGYLENAAHSMNLVEFEAHEKSKPAFVYSPLFKEMEQGIHAQGAQIMQGMVKGG